MIWKSNRIQDVQSAYRKKLSTVFDQNEARAMVNVLFEDFFDISSMDIVRDPDALLNESEMLQLHLAVKQLLLQVPIQHITGIGYFFGRRFKVGPEVLIPRPETEELLKLILDESGANEPLKILDIGTGSACLPISLALERPNAKISASELSSNALEIARFNAAQHGVELHFIQDDVLQPDWSLYEDNLDVILSNPPYIRPSEKQLMKENVVGFEPHLALFVPEHDPLLFYRAIVLLAQKKLKNGGRIYFEINEAFGRETCALLQEHGFQDIRLRKDLFERDRIVAARK